MSPLEMEVDAHFAEALYLVVSGKENEANSDLRMIYYMIMAKGFADDSDFLTTSYFRQKHQELNNSVFQHYQFMNKAINRKFNVEQFNKEFNKRTRLDGIPG
jgi:hypothetical protein